MTSAAVNPDRRLIAVDYDSSGTSYDEIEHCLNNLGYQIAARCQRDSEPMTSSPPLAGEGSLFLPFFAGFPPAFGERNPPQKWTAYKHPSWERHASPSLLNPQKQCPFVPEKIV